MFRRKILLRCLIQLRNSMVSKGNIMSKATGYPRVHLAIDNCFASKRWTAPSEWGRIIKDLGLKYIEASADNECDPFYNGSEYFIDWAKEVRQTEEQTGVKVANLYSGHGTYATLGLAHDDARVRDRMLNRWLKSMVDTASSLDAGLGFFCHGFSQKVLQDKQLYARSLEMLYEDLGRLAKYAAQADLNAISVEQMYTPHQVPWTIDGATNLLREVYARSASPFYLTIDVGHQCYQKRYQMPGRDRIAEYLRLCRSGQRVEQMWLGPESAYRIFNEALSESNDQQSTAVGRIVDCMNEYPHLFAGSEDGDPYRWLGELACWSPIIHLQQTDGTFSAHKPFNDEYNGTGIIKGRQVLEMIARAYQDANRQSLPPVCEEIYLTIEVFFGTGDMPNDIIHRLCQTVEYWRQFVPTDGVRLDRLLGIE